MNEVNRDLAKGRACPELDSGIQEGFSQLGVGFKVLEIRACDLFRISDPLSGKVQGTNFGIRISGQG
jgi:hypothetical protein